MALWKEKKGFREVTLCFFSTAVAVYCEPVPSGPRYELDFHLFLDLLFLVMDVFPFLPNSFVDRLPCNDLCSADRSHGSDSSLLGSRECAVRPQGVFPLLCTARILGRRPLVEYENSFSLFSFAWCSPLFGTKCLIINRANYGMLLQIPWISVDCLAFVAQPVTPRLVVHAIAMRGRASDADIVRYHHANSDCIGTGCNSTEHRRATSVAHHCGRKRRMNHGLLRLPQELRDLVFRGNLPSLLPHFLCWFVVKKQMTCSNFYECSEYLTPCKYTILFLRNVVDAPLVPWVTADNSLQ